MGEDAGARAWGKPHEKPPWVQRACADACSACAVNDGGIQQMKRTFQVALQLLVVMLGAMTVATIAPVLAPVVAHPPQHGLLSDFSPSARSLLYGLLLGIQPLLAICSAPLLGQLSDRIGRKVILLYTMSGLALANLGMALAISTGWVVFLIASGVIRGLTAGNHAVAQAALVDSCPPERKAFYLSLSLVASSVGFLAGPLLGGWLADSTAISWSRPSLPFYVLGAGGLLTVVLLALTMPGAPRDRPKPVEPVDPLSGLRALASSFRDRNIGRVSLVFGLMQVAWAAYFLFLPMFLATTEGFSHSRIGTLMAGMGVGFLVSYGVGLPVLAQFWSSRTIARAGLLLTAAGIAGSALAGNGVLQWLLIVLTGFVVSIAYGAILTLYSDAVDATRQGQILGISIAVVSGAWAVSSMVTGYFQSISPWAPIWFATAFMTLSFVVSLALPPPKEEAGDPARSESIAA
ncbi:MAG: MFS transporter [Reyranella sp.]|nr:MFS transporter [Reyranella sp.]